MIGEMSASHLIFIPATLLIGIVIGWVLGSRAAQDAFAAELRRREERAKRREKTADDDCRLRIADSRTCRLGDWRNQRPTDRRLARLAGRPAPRMRRCAASTAYGTRLRMSVGPSES